MSHLLEALSFFRRDLLISPRVWRAMSRQRRWPDGFLTILGQSLPLRSHRQRLMTSEIPPADMLTSYTQYDRHDGQPYLEQDIDVGGEI